MILLGNKQNSLILLGFFPFSGMEIPVYNFGECTPWGLEIAFSLENEKTVFANQNTLYAFINFFQFFVFR